MSDDDPWTGDRGTYNAVCNMVWIYARDRRRRQPAGILLTLEQINAMKRVGSPHGPYDPERATVFGYPIFMAGVGTPMPSNLLDLRSME